MPELTIDKETAEIDIIADIAKATSDKSVQDFVAGKIASCSDAKCTYDSNGGWTTLPDKSMYHEIDREVVKKYGLVDKPIYDSYYYHVGADGLTKKLLTHKEMLAVIAKQEVSDGNR